jgi:cyclic-di-GMP phosphodiesterase TipF (flagellum assembly factor)
MLNIEASMLKNGQFMKELVGFLGKNKEMASRIVFELPQIEIDTLDPALVPVMHALTKAGCRFSMDSVRRRRINVTRLKSLNIRFLKLDGAWLIREAQQPGGAARVSRLKNQLDGAGIDLIVERIESEDELRELLDFHVDYGQGYLFARPEHYGAWRDRHFPPKKIGRVA